MSDESLEGEIKIDFKKTKLSDNIRIKPSILNEKDLSLEEDNIIELNSKSKSITESTNNSNISNTSVNIDFSKELNFQFLKEPLLNEDNYSFLNNKKMPPEYDFFLCNEKNIKEKMPEGNKYKNNSRNYKLKDSFAFNTMEIEKIDINKVNEILKDIELYQNFINNDNCINIKSLDNIDLNKLENINIEPLCIDNTFLCSYINNKFDCKFLLI